MKKFLLRITFFLTPVLMLSIFGEILLRAIPNDYKIKAEQLKVNKEKIEVLIFGSSHAYRGVNPEYIDLKALNTANVSQTLDWDYRIFDKYSNQMPNLKHLVFVMSPFAMCQEMKDGISSWREDNYPLYYGIRKKSSKKIVLELTKLDLRTNSKRIINYYLKGQTPKLCNSHGFGKFEGSMPRAEFDSHGEDAARRHSIGNCTYYNSHLNYLKKIILSVKKQDVKILFVLPPFHKIYREKLDQQRLQQLDMLLDSLPKYHTHVKYINLVNSEEFNEKDFYNPDHLNAQGAEKLTSILNQKLSNNW